MDSNASRPADRAAHERGPTVARVAALAGVIAAIVLVAIVLFGGSSAYRVSAYFQNAGQLVEGNEVQVGGHVVGKVTDVELANDGLAKITMEVNDDAAPLHGGTQATIRTTSLSGIANRYVSLQPGPNSEPEIADGGRIGADETSAPVDLDQLFDTLDPKTRRALRQVVQGSATWYAGRSTQAGRSLAYLPAALSSTSRLTREVALDDKAFDRFLVDTARVVEAIAERRDDLSSLVSNTNQTAAAIGDENAALDRALLLLPGTLRKANTTFVNLRSTLDDLDPLVAESKPATKDLAPFLRALRPLVRDARPTVADLRELIRKPGRDNDLVELTAKMPRLERLTSTVFPRTIRTLDRAQPVVEYARQYAPDLAGYVTKFGQSASAYDANGHYARIQPMFSPYSLGDLPTPALNALAPGANRLSGFELRQLRRCPGGAVQPSPDGSAPWPVPDCDPGSSPPG